MKLAIAALCASSAAAFAPQGANQASSALSAMPDRLWDTMVDKTILKAQNRGLLLDDPNPGSLLDRLATTMVVHEPKWIGEEVT